MNDRSSRPPTDDTTTVSQLRGLMSDFVTERGWQRFHNPKNLASSLAIETGELMEHFQWLTTDEAWAVGQDRQAVAAIGEEMADCLCYLLSLANAIDLDLSEATHAKMIKNRQKYPADQCGPGHPAAVAPPTSDGDHT